MNRQEVLDVLNSLEVFESQGGDDAYMLVELTVENVRKLESVGIAKERAIYYGDEESTCLLSIAFGDGYATDYVDGKFVYTPMIKSFRKKPVTIQAIQWLPEKMFMADVLGAFGGLTGMGSRKITRQGAYLVIRTLEGDMKANPGDWIIKGIRGELYPCKPDVFEKTYEEVCSD